MGSVGQNGSAHCSQVIPEPKVNSLRLAPDAIAIAVKLGRVPGLALEDWSCAGGPRLRAIGESPAAAGALGRRRPGCGGRPISFRLRGRISSCPVCHCLRRGRCLGSYPVRFGLGCASRFSSRPINFCLRRRSCLGRYPVGFGLSCICRCLSGLLGGESFAFHCRCSS